MSKAHEVVLTRDGNWAVFDRAANEIMHPVGPMTEAAAVYVEPSKLDARLDEEHPAPLVLFDVGLGAGSNAITAWKASENRSRGRRLEIVSFDNTVAALELALDETHAAAFGLAGDAGDAARAIAATGMHHTDRTSWRLVLGELPAALDGEPAGSADIIFWDMYSARANPQMWNTDAFTRLRRVAGERATVHTYSAATSVRSAMLLAGFAVGFGVATGPKNQTTTAATELDRLEHPLDRRWLERLGRSSAPFPADAPADAMHRIAGARQFTRPDS